MGWFPPTENFELTWKDFSELWGDELFDPSSDNFGRNSGFFVLQLIQASRNLKFVVEHLEQIQSSLSFSFETAEDDWLGVPCLVKSRAVLKILHFHRHLRMGPISQSVFTLLEKLVKENTLAYWAHSQVKKKMVLLVQYLARVVFVRKGAQYCPNWAHCWNIFLLRQWHSRIISSGLCSWPNFSV
jgi:hypothetical protein